MYTPVLFDKEGEPGYFTFCEQTMEEQIAEFDQQLGVIHKLDGPIPDEDDDTKVKFKLCGYTQKLIIGIDNRHLSEESIN